MAIERVNTAPRAARSSHGISIVISSSQGSRAATRAARTVAAAREAVVADAEDDVIGADDDGADLWLCVVMVGLRLGRGVAVAVGGAVAASVKHARVCTHTHLQTKSIQVCKWRAVQDLAAS